MMCSIGQCHSLSACVYTAEDGYKIIGIIFRLGRIFQLFNAFPLTVPYSQAFSEATQDNTRSILYGAEKIGDNACRIERCW